MDVWEYLPKGFRRIVRKGSKRARLAEIVKELQDERDNLVREKNLVLDDNIRLIHENSELETVAVELQGEVVKIEGELGQMKKVYDEVRGARETLKKLVDLRKVALYLTMLGPESKLGRLDKREKDTIAYIVDGRINEVLVEKNRELGEDYVKVLDERNQLMNESFTYRHGVLCHEDGIDRTPAFGYGDGKIISATPYFKRRYGGGNLCVVLGNDAVLQEALKKGKGITRTYGGRDIEIIFEPNKELRKNGEDFVGASISPLNRGKRAKKVLSERGKEARKVINKNAGLLYKSGLYFKLNGKE